MIIGIGTDILEISRLEHVMHRSPALQKRVFSQAEITYCQKKASPIASFAASFAAKEAVLKTMGCGIAKFRLSEIEVIHQEGGKPSISLHGKALSYANSLGIKDFMLSLSHSNDNALAFVIAIGEER